MGSAEARSWGRMSGPGIAGGHFATARTDKYNKIPVDMVSNARAKRTIADKTPPSVAFDAMGYMRHMFRDTPADWKHLASGGFGSAFVVTVTDATKRRLKRLYDETMNKVDHSRIDHVPNKTKVVLKVITAGRENRYWEPNAEEKRYLEDIAADELKKRGVSHKKKIDPEIQRVINEVVAHARGKVRAMSPQRRRAFLNESIRKKRQQIWDFVLETGSLDASNHEYIMKQDPVTFKCATGTATVRARDVIPHFYFGGSHNPYGVYVVAMGFVEGKPLKNITPTPTIVANLEKAMFTLAASGVEHGDAHTANIFATLNGDVHLIDFGMSVILPALYKNRALRKLGACVRALQTKGEWPERWSNSVWYGNARHDGENTRSIMRYVNSYMRTKLFEWYNPSGKMMRYMKTLTTKAALDVARTRVWSRVCVRRRSPSPMSPLNLTVSSPNTTPRRKTPKRKTPKHTTPKHASPKHATPKHASPRHATPKRAPAKGTLPPPARGRSVDLSRKRTPRPLVPIVANPRYTLNYSPL